MIRKTRLYTAVIIGWWLLSLGIVVAVVAALFAGLAEPYVSPSQLSPLLTVVSGFVGLVALGHVGEVVVSVHETRAWRATGSRANLSPEDDGGLLRKPVLTSCIDGHTVRARVEGTTVYSRQMTTIVETDLDRPAAGGLLVAPVSGSQRRRKWSGSLEPERAVVSDEQFVVWGSAEPVARAIISGRARDALRGTDAEVYIGDVSDAVSSGTAMSESPLWSLFSKPWTWGVPADDSVVSIRTGGLVLDSSRLERQAEAVAAVADAFEKAPSTRDEDDANFQQDNRG